MVGNVRRIVRHRTVLAAIVVVMAYLGFQWYESFVAPARLDPALRQAMAERPVIGRVDVELGFTPEQYHIRFLQQNGLLGGVQRQHIFLMDVPVEDIWQLARVYWIESIRLAEQGG